MGAAYLYMDLEEVGGALGFISFKFPLKEHVMIHSVGHDPPYHDMTSCRGSAV